MTSGRTLEQVLADWNERASAARLLKDARVADLIQDFCDDVADSTEDYRTWLSESDAMLRSGRPKVWLRARFANWARQGLARWSPRNARAREYRALIVPMRSDVAAIRADAVRAARGDSAA